MSGYFIEVIADGWARIHEDTASYLVSREQAQASIEVVKAGRGKYASDDAWLRRIGFYEDILETLGRNGA